MYAARLIVVLLLILAVMVAYNPRTREIIVQTWENIKPGVVALMDGLYAAIRNLVTGNGSDRINNDPAPDPGTHFQRVVAFHGGFSF